MTDVQEPEPGSSRADATGASRQGGDGDPPGFSTHTLPEHPIGTLVIVLIYAAVFAVAWAWVYFGLFLGRGAPTS